MKAVYDRHTDTLTFQLTNSEVQESDETHPGIILDYDESGNIVGLEILNASKRNIRPDTMEFQVNG
jgi:uncharacterized protein YuzE